MPGQAWRRGVKLRRTTFLSFERLEIAAKTREESLGGAREKEKERERALDRGEDLINISHRLNIRFSHCAAITRS